MKPIKKKIVVGVLLAVISTGVKAVPAKRGPITCVAEDGTEQVVYLHGDEHFHYMTNAQGEWLDEQTLKQISEETQVLRKQRGEARLAAHRARQATTANRLLAPRGAIILVSFADKAFSATNEEMTEWAMGDNYSYNGATGSVRKYFLDQSWGAYDMQIDVYGPVTVSNGYAYYGKDSGGEGNDQHPDEMIKEACILAHDSCGADFSQYDVDNDGEVDWVVILYAGKGQADGGGANTIWPHQYDLSYTGMSFKLDGKTVDHYCCLNEIDGQSRKRCGIGTFCHEFSHIMGLPDLYSTDNGKQKTMGEWDILDYGPYNNNGNTPPAYSAYERWFMGWLTPTLLHEAASVTMYDLSQAKAAAYITASGDPVANILRPNPNMFYILENRQKANWDKYLPGDGMLVTRINYRSQWWANNTVNNSADNMGVDLIEADGEAPSYVETKPRNGYFGKSTDAYPAGATEFTQVESYPVTNITLENGLITFDVNGGGDPIVVAIENIEDGVKAHKLIRNGQVIIVRGGVTYDITGRKL